MYKLAHHVDQIWLVTQVGLSDSEPLPPKSAFLSLNSIFRSPKMATPSTVPVEYQDLFLFDFDPSVLQKKYLEERDKVRFLQSFSHFWISANFSRCSA